MYRPSRTGVLKCLLQASPEVLIRVSHVMVGVWAIVMSCVACLWNGIGISLNWLFLFSGTLYTSAVGPIVMTVLWRKQTRLAVISGALGGLCIGVICWLVVAKAYYGELTIETTGASHVASALCVLTKPLAQATCIPISPEIWALVARVRSSPLL